MTVSSRTVTRLLLSFALVSVAAAGCKRDQPPGGVQPVPPTPAPMASTPAPVPPPAPADPDRLAGTVVETMDSGGYTYARIDRGGAPVWIAGPATKLAVGARVEATGATLMNGFRSETLQRTFEQIYFVSSYGGAEPAAAPAAAPVADPHAAPTAAAPEKLEKIEKAAGGKTIAEVFASKAALAGKPVIVRGKVVKLNTGILGRNWIHLQDGSGTAAARTHDLLITTTEAAKLGDVIVARGTLVTDKDFGGGYQYDVVVENATLASK